jgi:hypothetical protein
MRSKPGRVTRIGLALVTLTVAAVALVRLAGPAEAQNGGPVFRVSSPFTVKAGSQINSGILNPTRRPITVKFWVVDGTTGETQESEPMMVDPGRTGFFTVSPSMDFSGVVQVGVVNAPLGRQLSASVQINDNVGLSTFVVDLSTDGGATFPSGRM